MSNESVGIDISMFQATVPDGPWLFVIHKATEGHSYVDPKFADRYATLPSSLRGAYHYARPLDTDGAQQANHFADTCLAAGFRPGVDIWQLDAEDGENVGARWQPFIDDFMTVALARLGSRGFLYAGYPFAQSHGLTTTVSKYHWWLPDYSVNDGQVHPVQTPANLTPLVVLHQFTSAGGLDQNVVANQATWDAMFAPAIDFSALAKLAAFIKAATGRTLKRGAKGTQVLRLNQLLLKHGYSVSGDGYDARTAAAVASFKATRKLKNRDGNACGRACALALLKGVK